MSTPLPPPNSPRQLEDLVLAMRDELLKVSFVLRDHLFEADDAGREQARQTAEQLIQRAKDD